VEEKKHPPKKQKKKRTQATHTEVSGYDLSPPRMKSCMKKTENSLQAKVRDKENKKENYPQTQRGGEEVKRTSRSKK